MKKILLVEDDAFIQDNLNELLNELGFEVILVSNGIEALNDIEKRLPDIIISDVKMPKMNGIEFRKRILEIENTKNIPFIYLSAVNYKELIHEKDKLGNFELIPKPYKIADVKKILHNK